MPEIRRNAAVDAFRGIAIALMIIVNNQGDWSHVYRPLRHAAWHGWSGADIVFPFFLFIMGTSIAISFSARRDRGEGNIPFGKIASRSAILFALGLALNLFPDFDIATLRIPGVLQRIGICYFFAALIHEHLGQRPRLAAFFLILGTYGAILKFSGPGPDTLSPEGNICLAVDRYLLHGHTYPHAPVAGFDPEGTVSTLGALASALAGTFAGDFLVSAARKERERARFTPEAALLAFGAAAIIAGLVMDLWMPINKNLWTPSYVLFMAGMASSLLAALHWIVEKRRISSWATPFLALGMNAITVYVLSSAAGKFLALLKLPIPGVGMATIKGIIFTALFASLMGPHAASLAWSLAFCLFWTGAMFLLYRKNIFFKI